MTATLESELARLESILRGHGVTLARHPGATDADIARTEAQTRIRFDDDLRALYRWSNGGTYEESWFAVRTDQLAPFRFMSLDEVCEVHSWQETSLDDAWDNGGEPWDPRHRRYDRHSLWLPFADFGNGSAVVLFDADPTPSGRYGQILTYQHDPDAIRYFASGLTQFLVQSNDLLERHFTELWE